MRTSLGPIGGDVSPKPAPPWLDQLPANWPTVPLRFLVRITSGNTPDMGKAQYWNGDIPWVSPKDMKRLAIADSMDHVTEAALRETALALVPTGSVLLVVRGMILAHSIPVAITIGPVTINQDMKALRCNPALHPQYLLAVFQEAAAWWVSQADESSHGTKRLDTAVLGRFEVPCPNIKTQRAIVDYLNRETARLDALVAANQQLLGHLAEKRRALITRAVTRGLDPDASHRDSGIPWLGQIPAHWDVVALQFLVDLTSGATPRTGEAEYWDGEIPWVSPKDMKQNEIAGARDHVSELALSESTLRLIEPGAVLIVVRGMILTRSFPVAVTTKPVTINQDIKAIRCRSALEPYYLRDFLRGASDYVVSLADSSAHGTRKLETARLGHMDICIPPISEQRAIVAHVNEAGSRIDSLRAATRTTITLLKERRSALIAAAVTGQLDIETAA